MSFGIFSFCNNVKVWFFKIVVLPNEGIAITNDAIGGKQ
jgi:hypothetical protein